MWSGGLKWLARAFFAAAVAALAYGWWIRPRQPEAPHVVREKPVVIDWAREPFHVWTSVEDGIRVQYPARFDETRGFGRFTSRALTGGITETDVVAFRSGVPRCVLVIALYRAARPLSWAEWEALAEASTPAPDSPTSKAPSVFAAEFGGSRKQFQPIRVDRREGLQILAQGAVKYPGRGNEVMELWDLRSRLFAQGTAAVRITGGVHHDQLASTVPGIDRTLSSFRWTPRRER